MKRIGATIVVALLIASPFSLVSADTATADGCDGAGLRIQVLGSGGADMVGGRAGSSYLVWMDGKARALVDFGAGAALRFVSSRAHASDLDLVLFTHLHSDHALDLPQLISLAEQDGRTRTLTLYGPTGNRFAPSIVTFVRSLLDETRGVYRQFGDVLSPLAKGGFKLDVQELRAPRPPVGVRREEADPVIELRPLERLQVAGVYVIHGSYPALAWRIRAKDRTIVFSGDMNGEGGQLERLAQNADLLVAHHAVLENAAGTERYAHMPPSVIGHVAAQANVKRLVLSHRTRRTLGQEETSLAAIRSRYAGPVAFADDLECFVVP